jgi:hypothetical protein
MSTLTWECGHLVPVRRTIRCEVPTSPSEASVRLQPKCGDPGFAAVAAAHIAAGDLAGALKIVPEIKRPFRRWLALCDIRDAARAEQT